MRLIRAVCVVPALASLVLMGCGGSDVAVNSPATANETGVAGTGAATATLKWVAPTENTNGTALTDLAGYNIYYGTESSQLTQTIQVANPAALSYVVSGLASGTTWYFQVTSYSSAGEESAPSAVTSKTT